MSQDAALQIVLAIVSSAFTSGLAFGILRTKIGALEMVVIENKKQIEETESLLSRTRETYTSSQSMETALNHVYNQLNAMQKDIKDILRSVRQ